ncbi:3-dehydrosphinganine reductase TSC10A isoform X4 [Amborella trichopoda]|uniref:3-dehydrosphinganine reductase TSC10A isoform X4 n=1 Tax=Amborella trichopoda TaxID=13333 RepID=UPI0009BF62D4|nr:3-dehydrosphinganine reductase TSC10A isoform X4 [Amborella trichopoda]|eukprot:XP_020526878.1 3-dehydrosphinganine reductase TSC10A isoform X4 [Amborella trichopoda]
MASSFFLLLMLLVVAPLALLLFLRLIARPRLTKVPIKGRHVLISGGSSGIGLAMAELAAMEGASCVSILARDPRKLEDAKCQIQLSTGLPDDRVRVLIADVRDFEGVKRVVEEASAGGPPVDVLVCNQGVFVPQELESQEMDTAKYMVDINLIGTLHLIKAVLPQMKHRDDPSTPASIALMSSQAGQVGIYGYVAYSASKFGLRGLGEALQQEVIVDNIRVSLIFPPETQTPGLLEENKTKPEITKIIAASSYAMEAKEVARKALDGIKAGRFIVTCNFEGFMLSIATAGVSPQTSYGMAFIEVVAAGFIRVVGLCFLWNWFGIAERWHAERKKVLLYCMRNEFAYYPLDALCSSLQEATRYVGGMRSSSALISRLVFLPKQGDYTASSFSLRNISS